MTSIITTCAIKGWSYSTTRGDALAISLASWLATNVDEIVIVDWGCDLPAHKLTQDPRVRVVQVEASKWSFTTALNLGVTTAKSDKILKLDIDHVLNPYEDFLSKHILEPGIFYRGYYDLARTVNERHLNGLLYCYHNDILRVNGYSEHITEYGEDDNDLFQRMTASGLIAKPIEHDTVLHLPHDHSLRYHSDINASNAHNRHVIATQPWTKDDKCHQFEITWDGQIGHTKY